MIDERAYRIQVQFVPESSLFRATVPELDLSVEADSRSEAIAQAEQGIEDKLQELAATGAAVPEPIDGREIEGPLSIALSKPLARELAYQAAQEGLEPEVLARDLLALALGGLERRAAPKRRRPEEDDRENEPQQDGGDRQRRGRRRREGYRPELEDKANFLEYLRKLEKGGGQRGGPR